MLKKVLLTTVSVALFAAAQAPAPAPAPGGRGRGPQGPVVVSPEVLPDHRVTFRILAPDATTVGLRGGDIPQFAGGGRGTPPPPALEFKKGENGVWEGTTNPSDPGTYRYTLTVNGVAVIDPRNPATSESNNNTWSVFTVPGADFMDAKKDIPHGAVAAINYYSSSLSKFRRMHIYTPPGYELGGNQKYPVFYLLHGASDSDDSWTSAGRANYILDNLIAAKKAKPMIVVMPAGHTSQQMGGGRGAATAGAPPPVDEFTQDFVNDIMPYVEKNYRTANDRAHRAIAGLSMGGSQTMNIAFLHLDKFSQIGVFSSGILGSAGTDTWEKAHLANLDNASLKKGVKTVWFSTGVNDGLITNSKATVELLKKHGFDASFKESPGAHTWINWREYLNQFTPLLFQ